MERLKNKIAVITGGSQGIGRATVEKFVNEGCKVAIWDIDEVSGETLSNDFNAKGFDTFFQKVNVADMDNVQAAVKSTLAKYGTIDILVNNAGITKDATLKKMTSEQWQKVIDVNLTGVFNCTSSISTVMLEKGTGRILNASSVVGLYGNFGQTNYVATKAGVIGMTKVWARELGRKGITVNAVAPGFIATEMVKAMPENVIKMMEDKTPVGRLGKPEDIANAYLFLSSDEASFINGAVLSVDGGIVI
ncbi:MAG: 3-oxoacyl-ACP reductase FabG [Bacteroidetes bacterium]|nr:3-oxoacyl-ACP reductase FabG [Bacteroidota bacterium]